MADTDYLKLSSQLLDILSPYYKGAGAKSAGRFEGAQYRNNARLTLREGERTAQDIRKAGRIMESDATVAMIAQGGTVDHSMLAKMKRKHEMNAIAAMYDAKADALQQEFAARQAEKQGEREYRAGVIGMFSNILSAGSTYGWGKGSGAPKVTKAKTRGDWGSWQYGSTSRGRIYGSH